MGDIQDATNTKGNTMTITITPKSDRNRELNHAETIVETNSKGQCLCQPKYGCHWTIVTPTRNQPGMNCLHWIGGELEIKAQWNANYADK